MADTKNLEARLRAAEEELLRYRVIEKALDVTQTLFAIMDMTSRMLHASSAHKAVLGYEPEEIRGAKGFDLIHPEDRKKLVGLLADYVKKFMGASIRRILGRDVVPITETVTYRARHKSGDWVWLESVGTILDKKIYCISRDVTARVNWEKTREGMRAQLVQAAKLASVGTLTAGLAHQLNNPLTAVIGFAELIEAHPNDPDAVVLRATRIHAASERMKSIVDRLCRFNRTAVGGEQKPLSIADTIRNATAILEPVLEDNDIDVSLQIEDDLPRIEGDPGLLEGVFQNLIMNAKDAFEAMTDGRQKRIRIAVKASDHKITVVVEDNAGGMSQKVAARAFDPFYSTKDVGSGTGLGLFVTHGVVQAHEGTISLATKKGEGTTFTITLPAARVRDPAPA